MSRTPQIEDHMTDYPSVAPSAMTVIQAMDFMQKNDVRHLPVVEHGQVIGIVSERDLKQAEILSDAMTLVVTDIMTPNPYCVRVGTPLLEVTQEMAKHKYGCTIVLNQLGRVVGIFTTSDGMRVLSELIATHHDARIRDTAIDEALAPKRS